MKTAAQVLRTGVVTSVVRRRVQKTRCGADQATGDDGDVEVLMEMSIASGVVIFAGAIHGNNRGKTDGVTTAMAGGNLTYTIVVSNAGQSAATSAIGTDLFTPTFTAATFTASGTSGSSGASNRSCKLNNT